MIRLDNTTRSLVALLDANVTTSQANVVVNYSDNNGTTYAGGTQVSVSNNTTQFTMCSAPAASTVRDIDNIVVYNNDTVPLNINIIFNDNGTLSQIIDVNLQVDDTLTYTHAAGWKTTDINGNTKTIYSGGAASSLIGVSALPNGVTATTQTTGDNTAKVATNAFVNSSIAAYSAAMASFGTATTTLGGGIGGESVSSGVFTITGTFGAFSVGTPVIITMGYMSPQGGQATLYDDQEMDGIIASGVVINSTTVQVNWSSTSRVCGPYVFNYQVM